SVSSPSARNVISWFICKPCDCNTSYRRRLGLVSSVCTNPRRLCDRDLASSSSPKLRTLLPTMTSKLCCLSNQWRTYPPSMPTVKAPSGCGKRTQLLGLPSIKPDALFVAVCSSSILAETLDYTASFSSSWRGKRRVFEQRKPFLTDQLQLSTNADKLSEDNYEKPSIIVPLL